MNLIIHPDFEYIRDELIKAISNFDSYTPGFNTGKRNSVTKIDLIDKTVIIKSFKEPNLINKIVYKYVRKSKAERSYEYAMQLTDMGIRTPRPIAYLENFSLLGLKDSYYISEFLDYDLTFRELIHQENYPKREIILKAFTKFTYMLHEKGILFLDHSPGNTLISIKDTTYEFYLVDLNRMQFKNLSFDERMQNFARLTPKKEMIEIMSSEYARLAKIKSGIVFEKMWGYTQQFRIKFQRKKKLKKIISFK